MRSIRSRLTVMLVIGMSVLLVGAGALISSVFKSRLQDELDQVLKGETNILMTRIEDKSDKTELDTSDNTAPAGADADHPEASQRWFHGQLAALIRTLNLLLAGLMVMLLVIAVVFVHVALRASLQPLDEMRHQVSRLDVSSLTTGIQLHTETAELMPVVHQMNALLHRLDVAFSRERQFSSDVAHELRTPLAELRTLTEVGGRWPDDREAVRQYFADAHGICEQMERVVISLLTLTRCESGVQPVQMTSIPLHEIVETSWQNIKQTATENSQHFECHIPQAYTIISDSDMLLIMLNNLLSNAVLHSAPSSVIRCVALRNGTSTYLTISNPVKELVVDDLDHIFERFWRKDIARSDGTHSGLGLSIVKAFADLLNVDIQARLDNDQTFSVRLSL